MCLVQKTPSLALPLIPVGSQCRAEPSCPVMELCPEVEHEQMLASEGSRQGSLAKKELVSSDNSRLQSITMREPEHQELEAAGHPALTAIFQLSLDYQVQN